MRWTWLAVLTLATGCDGIDLEQLVRQHPARTRVTAEPPGVHCEHGGSAVLSGLDLDDDGVLDDTEVTSTEYACATVMLRVSQEQAGTHCEHGGRAVHSGVDLNADGTLEDAEVTATEYVCATPVPGLLVRTRAVPPGERCPQGGQVSHAGHDTNGDGVLDDSEIAREVYGCTETAPVVVGLTSIPPLAGFCNTEGTEVEAGPDLDRDGVLDAVEVQSYTRLCLNRVAVWARQRPEPAGTHCPVAGTAVLVGVDSNGDGTLGEDEAHQRLYVCEPARTFDGTYEVAGAADLVALQGITRIRGGLFIRGTALQEVALPGLVSVEGRLSIQSNPDLLHASLPALRFVDGELDVIGNPLLETLELGGADERPLSVATDLEVSSNPRLRTLGGLRFVAPARNLTVNGNASLESLAGLDQVTVLTGHVTVSGNGALPRIDLPKLEAIGKNFHLSDNASLTTLGDLSALRSVGEDVVITNNDALVNLSGMPILHVVGESLRVHDNDALLSTEGLDHLRRLRHLAVFDNVSLETAGHLPMLESIDYGLALQNNPKLVSVSNLPMLTHVGTLVSITDNPLLTQLQGLQRLLRLKQLTVANNAALPSLSGLTGLRELEELTVRENAELLRLDLGGLVSVSTRFTVAHNPKLPRCLAVALAESAYDGLPDDSLIEGNDDTTPCGP
ncbi:hypothetical protein ACLESD_35665 [Pyxidicoccus sp. 3LFB2]